MSQMNNQSRSLPPVINRHRRNIIAVCAIIVAYLAYSQVRYSRISACLDEIAGALLTSQQSSRIVHVGTNTAAQLQVIASTCPDAGWEIKPGDTTFGNGQADACILYVCEDRAVLGLRIRHDWGEHHILGFWTP